MKKLYLLLIFFGCAFAVNAQDSASVVIPDCPFPSGCVTVSRAVAEKALVDAETVTAQASEIAVLKKALSDQQDLTVKLKIEFAEKVGEVTALRQNAVSDRAIMQVLVQKVGKRCSPLSILCF